MKTTRSLPALLLLIPLAHCHLLSGQTVLGPGWATAPTPELPAIPELMDVPPAQPPTAAQRENLTSASFAPPPGNSEAAAATTPPESTPGVPPFSVSAMTDADTPSAEIIALAEGLRKDPVAMFNWVRDNIRYVHYVGCKKGARLTLLERAGNDIDTCTLLMALFRSCSPFWAPPAIQAGYVSGWVKIPFAVNTGSNAYFDAARWLAIYSANQAFVRLQQGGSSYPASVDYEFSGDGSLVFHLKHTWLQVRVAGGPVYYLDPSFKITDAYLPGDVEMYEAGNGLTSAAVNYDRAALLTAAGVTDESSGDSVSGLSETGIANYLQGRCAGLQTWLAADASRYSRSPIESFGGIQTFTLPGLTGMSDTRRFPFEILVNSTNRLIEAWPTGVPVTLLSKLTISRIASRFELEHGLQTNREHRLH